MKDIVYPVCAGTCWAAVLYRVPDLWKDWRNPVLIALCTTFLFLALTYTGQIPAVAAGVDRITGIPNLGALIIHTTAVSCIAAVQVLILLWAHPPGRAWRMARMRLTLFGVALVIMVTLFTLADVKKRDPHFLLQNAGRPLIAAYLLFYETVLAIGIATAAKMFLEYAKIAPRVWLRRGLNVATAAAALELFYCVTRVTTLIGTLAGANPNDWEVLIPLFSGGGGVLAAVGLTMPAWGPRLSALREWMNQYRAHRNLYPLWEALHRELRTMAINPPRSAMADRMRTRDMGFRLHRRVIEIRDGQRALARWAEPGVNGAAAELNRRRGLTGDQLAAAIEAAKLRAALRAKATGSIVKEPVQPYGPVRGGDDLASETEWLTLVARAFADRNVADTVTRLRRRRNARWSRFVAAFTAGISALARLWRRRG